MKILAFLEKKIVLWMPSEKHMKTRDFLVKIIFFLKYPELRSQSNLRIRSFSFLSIFSLVLFFSFYSLNSSLVRKVWGYRIDSVLYNDEINHDLLKSAVIEIFENKNIGQLHKEVAKKQIEKIPVEHLKFMYQRCIEKDIPLEIFFSLVYTESKFDSVAESGKGAYGYCQIIPSTFQVYAKKLGLKGGNYWKNNIIASTEFLSESIEIWGKWELALASYNAGPGNVNISGGKVPPFPETENYVRFIMDNPDESLFKRPKS